MRFKFATGSALRAWCRRGHLTRSLRYYSPTAYPDAQVDGKYAYAYGRSPCGLQYRSVAEILRERANRDGSQIALISEHESITSTFGQLDTEVDHLVHALKHELGLHPGDVVALWSSNCHNSIIVQLACARYGLIICPLNPVYKTAELEYALEKSEAKLLFLPGVGSDQETVNNFTQHFGQVSFNHLKLKHVVHFDGNKLESARRVDSHMFKDLVSHGQKDTSDEDSISVESPSIIMFTSGTTGKPKGAVLSQHGVVNVTSLLASRLQVAATRSVSCIPLPLFHVFGMVFGPFLTCLAGKPLVLTGYKYSAQSVVNAVNKHSVTHLMTVPAMTIDITNYLEKEKIQIPSVTSLVTGGAPTPVEVAKGFIKAVPTVKNFLQGYGATEASGVIAVPYLGEDLVYGMHTNGKPLDMVQVKVVDSKTEKVKKLNEQGEIWIRGPNVMLGYWKDEEKTKEAITSSGWYKTGDIGILDENGRVRIVGRTKEMIIRGGENVYPAEVERLLHQHPDVQGAAVCGVPDQKMGEEICAWVILKENSSVTAEEIRVFCKEKISKFKVPRYVLSVQSIPTTPTGKVQKFKMTEQSCKVLGLSS